MTWRLHRRPCRRVRGGEAGFTLVEILVVITIIGLIMALVGPRVLNYLAESKVKAARIQVESFASSLDLFYLDAGRYPRFPEVPSINETLPAFREAPIWFSLFGPAALPRPIEPSESKVTGFVGGAKTRPSPISATCSCSARATRGGAVTEPTP